MSFEASIHDAQTAILRELLFLPSSNFAALQQPTGMTSDHFNFHISRLVDLGLVERISKGQYRLTITGKEYANKLDTDQNTIERQPKLAVLLLIHNDAGQVLVQQRVKNPNYGFYGFPTGKVRWGETILEAAHRECLEETNLNAEFIERGVHHEHIRLREPDELIEDKLFFICETSSYSGQLRAEFEGGKNEWLTIDELKSKDKTFIGLEAELRIMAGASWLIEDNATYDRLDF